MLSKTVQEISEIRMTGNIIPISWYKEIRKERGNKKKDMPDMLAVQILADIVYWYKATEIRDEETGQVLKLKKKFRADKLQKDYRTYAEMFDVSKGIVKAAFDNLERLGLVKREFREIVSNGMRCNNVMFVEPVPEKIREITWKTWKAAPDTPPSPEISEEAPQKKQGTNTEITTKITKEKRLSVLNLNEEDKKYLTQVIDLRKEYTDNVPDLNKKEIKLALELRENCGEETVLRAFKYYLDKKPTKAFMFFALDVPEKEIRLYAPIDEAPKVSKVSTAEEEEEVDEETVRINWEALLYKLQGNRQQKQKRAELLIEPVLL